MITFIITKVETILNVIVLINASNYYFYCNDQKYIYLANVNIYII